MDHTLVYADQVRRGSRWKQDGHDRVQGGTQVRCLSGLLTMLVHTNIAVKAPDCAYQPHLVMRPQPAPCAQQNHTLHDTLMQRAAGQCRLQLHGCVIWHQAQVTLQHIPYKHAHAIQPHTIHAGTSNAHTTHIHKQQAR